MTITKRSLSALVAILLAGGALFFAACDLPVPPISVIDPPTHYIQNASVECIAGIGLFGLGVIATVGSPPVGGVWMAATWTANTGGAALTVKACLDSAPEHAKFNCASGSVITVWPPPIVPNPNLWAILVYTGQGIEPSYYCRRV